MQNSFLNLQLRYNSLDRKFLPTKGITAELDGLIGFNRDYYLRTSSSYSYDPELYKKDTYYRILFRFEGYQSVHPRLSMLGKLYTAQSYRQYSPAFNHFMLGLNEGQLFVNSATIAQVGLQWRMYGELYGLLRSNIGLFNYEDFKSLKDADFYSGGAITLAYNLSVMPLEFSLMYSPEIDKVYVNARIGFIF